MLPCRTIMAAQLRLLDTAPMELTRLRERLTSFYIRRDLLISSSLRFHKLHNLLRVLLWYADYTIEICDQNVSRVDRSILFIALKSDWYIDL